MLPEILWICSWTSTTPSCLFPARTPAKPELPAPFLLQTSPSQTILLRRESHDACVSWETQDGFANSSSCRICPFHEGGARHDHDVWTSHATFYEQAPQASLGGGKTHASGATARLTETALHVFGVFESAFPGKRKTDSQTRPVVAFARFMKVERAMIMTAGLGTRMRPFTNKLPKPLLKVGRRTLLERLLDQLEQHHVSLVLLNLHYLGHHIADRLQQRRKPRIVLLREKEILHAGGGIHNALPFFLEEPFFLLNADILLEDPRLDSLQDSSGDSSAQSSTGQSGTEQPTVMQQLRTNTEQSCIERASTKPDNVEDSALRQLQNAWNDEKMDALFLLRDRRIANGDHGAGDCSMTSEGRLCVGRKYVDMGVRIFHPRFFSKSPTRKFQQTGLRWLRLRPSGPPSRVVRPPRLRSFAMRHDTKPLHHRFTLWRWNLKLGWAVVHQRTFGLKSNAFWRHVGDAKALQEVRAESERSATETVSLRTCRESRTIPKAYGKFGDNASNKT